MPLPALIFDHDGTLVDSEALHFVCWQDVMRNYGVNITQQEYIDYHNGISTLQNAEVFIQTYGLAETPENLTKEKHTCFTRRAKQQAPSLMPGAIEVLIAARQAGHKLAIATGTTRANLEQSSAAHGFHAYIHTSVCRDDVEQGKPSPDVYLLACQRLDVKPDNAIAFEDTPIGVEAAKAARLFTIAIPNAFSKSEELGMADRICESLLAAFDSIQHL